MTEISKYNSIKSPEKIVLAFFCVMVILIYFCLPTKEFYWDGIIFSQIIEDTHSLSPELFNPNHLFYNVIGYLAYQTAHFLGWTVRMVYIFQTISSLFSIGCAAIFFYALKSCVNSFYLTLSLTLLLAFSPEWWKFSTDADAYLPCIFFLLLGFYFLLPGKPPRTLLVALLHSCAMFLHELAVLFFPVVIAGLIFQTVSLERKKRLIVILKYSLAAFLLTFGVYCFSYYTLYGDFDLQKFFLWITWFEPSEGFSKSGESSLVWTLRGHLRLFINGRSGYLDRSLTTVSILTVLVASLIFLIVKVVRNFADIRKIWNEARKNRFYIQPTAILCVVWIVPYAAFLFFFIPKNTFYRLFYLPALIFLLGLFLAPFENLKPRLRKYRLAGLVFTLFLSNFIFYILPNSRLKENSPEALAVQTGRVWTNKTVVYYYNLSQPELFVRYFTPAVKWKQINAMSPDEFDADLQKVKENGGTSWLENSAFDGLTAQSPNGNVVFNSRNDAPLENPNLEMRFVEISPTGQSEKQFSP